MKQEIELIKGVNQSSKVKKINQSYFKLADTFHQIISTAKGVKSLIEQQKEIVVNLVEQIKGTIPIATALKVFNISRTTFQCYKSIVIHKCERSYFNWCTRKFSNQLLSKEVLTIKKYMNNANYKHWSKSSIYLKALRDKSLHCCAATFYKYCRLLGFKNKPRKLKSGHYKAVKTTKANEIWCADGTIYKTGDNVKQYIHLLIDHYSNRILGYRIEKSNSALAIKSLIHKAYTKYQPKKLQLLTDGGSENVNTLVSDFIELPNIPIQHIIAQKDVRFSNSMIEAINKIIKHQFLYHKEISSKNQLSSIFEEIVNTYNSIRPQMSLGGNTPIETFNETTIDLSRYTNHFKEQREIRKQQNTQNNCTICL